MKIGTGDTGAHADRLAGFLADHADHGSGFFTDYPGGVGSGRISITCKGCGARIERGQNGVTVEAAEGPEQPPARREPEVEPEPNAVIEPEAEAEPFIGRRAGAQRESKPGPPPPPPPSRRPGPPAEPVAGARPSRSRIWIGALAAVAAISALVAIVRIAGQSGDSGSGRPAQAPSAAPGLDQNQGASKPSAPPQPTQPAPAPGAAAARTVRGPGYQLRLPAGWHKSTRDGAIVFAPAGSGDVEVRLFYDRSSGLSLTTMAGQTARLLSDEHSGARISQLPGAAGEVRILARYRSGTSEARAIAAGPARILIITGADHGASKADLAAAKQLGDSFRTR